MSDLFAVCGGAETSAIDVVVVGWTGITAPQTIVTGPVGVVVPVIGWRVTFAEDGDHPSIGRLRVSGLSPNVAYTVAIGDSPTPETTVRTHTLPDVLPEDGTTFLLGSCYFRENDKGKLWDAFRDLTSADRPVFKLLVGDQIYGDVDKWTLTLLERAYLNKYFRYWREPTYRAFLADTPNFFTCDDHEFWNNAPEFQFQIPWTYTEGSRNSRFKEALDAFGLYQTERNAAGGFWQVISLPPVSIFVADTRSERTVHAAQPRSAISGDQWKAIDAWAIGLQGPGFLVLGQPLFDDAGGGRDYGLAAFENDYRRLWDTVELSTHDIVVLTGDIHIGRLATSGNLANPNAGKVIHEITASPNALVVAGGGPDRDTHAPGVVTTDGGLPRGDTRKVDTEWGTTDRNFALVKLFPIPNSTRVRAEIKSWSIDTKSTARNRASHTPALCASELILS